MLIRLQQIIPTPLQEKQLAVDSDIWGKECLFSSGECIKITAASGRGKTTLVHFLIGLRADYSGTLTIQEKKLSNFSAAEMAIWRREQLGVVFQDLRLFPHLTIRENIELKTYLAPRHIGENTVEWMAEQLGIADLLNTQAGICSYGEQQRAAIIRALAQPFAWLLLDEPFSHLDNKNTAIAASLILQIVQRNNAGLLLADLDENNYFPYHKTYML